MQEELPDLLQRWLEYWVCFGVLTSMERVPLVSTAVAAVLPYGSLLSVTLRLWLVVPLVHGTHALFLLLRTYVLTSAVSTAAAVSRGSPAMRSIFTTARTGHCTGMTGQGAIFSGLPPCFTPVVSTSTSVPITSIPGTSSDTENCWVIRNPSI